MSGSIGAAFRTQFDAAIEGPVSAVVINAQKAIGLALWDSLMSRTPRWSGRLQFHWNPSINRMDREKGKKLPRSAKNVHPTPPRQKMESVVSQLTTLKDRKELIINNSVPYVEIIEFVGSPIGRGKFMARKAVSDVVRQWVR